jgi:hypothetical protein
VSGISAALSGTRDIEEDLREDCGALPDIVGIESAVPEQ